MKRFLYATALLLCLSATVVSCNKDSGGSSSSIVGTWKVVWRVADDVEFNVGLEITLEKGGTMLFDGYPYVQYRYDASTKILKFGGSYMFKVSSLTSNSMTWSNPDDDNYEIVRFERQ